MIVSRNVAIVDKVAISWLGRKFWYVVLQQWKPGTIHFVYCKLSIHYY